MKIQTPEDLFLQGLEFIYDAEQQLTEILPKMAAASSSPQLRSCFEHHLAETKEHVGRAQEVFKRAGKHPESKLNRILKQMHTEIEEIIENTSPSPIRDAALIVAGNQVEHFEIASYGSLVALAGLLGIDDAAGILLKTLDEEKRADAKLTSVAEEHVNLQAVHRSAAAAAGS